MIYPCVIGFCLDGECAYRWTCDGDPCTDDVCENGVCTHPPDDGGACPDDGNPCTDDVCSGGACTHPADDGGSCQDDGNPCTDDVCSGGVCTHPGNSDPCNDGNACTDDDVCSGGACAGVTIVCDDGNQCTTDNCDPGWGCYFTPETGTFCDDGDPCTEDDGCEYGVCIGREVDCSDNNPCTSDACDPDTGVCTHSPVAQGCDDGDPCTTNDSCDNGVCTGTPDPECPWPTCPLNYVVDGHGYAEDFPYTRTTRVIIPQGTRCVGLRVYYFSREYPVWTGQQSVFDDELTFEATAPDETIASGSTTVNPLHDLFESGPYPGGNYVIFNEVLDFASLTEYDDSWIDLTATAVNISDGLYGSGVAFRVKCNPIDLDVDTNRDGQITDSDDDAEEEWSWGPDGAGAVFLGNTDDDDWADGHTVATDMDGLTPGIDNDDDSGDLARVIIRQADLPPDWNVWLSSAADVNVTVYDLSSGEAVLGFHAGGQTIYEVPTDSVVAGDIQFGVESNDLLHYGTLANAPLILELRDEYFDLLCRDEVNLRLSSWVMTSNLDQAETVYVRQLPPEDPLAGESAQFVADLQATLAGSGTNLVVIDDPYYGGDVWVQDQIEIGFTSYRDGSSLPVVFNSPRDRTDIPPNHGLRDFAERELFRADMGYFTTGSDAGTQDSFGNLEVTPPVTVNGKEYTFGRIYTGMGMQLDIQLNFLSRQVVQDPFTLYTGWLKVEHVDEVITFVPDLFAGGGAFKILIADPTLGTSILESEPNPGAKTIGKPGTMTVQEALDAYRTGNINYYPPNTASIKIALMSELGLGEGAFIAIPGFFQYPGAGTGTPVYNEGSSLLPNLANVLVVNGRLIVAEPFYDGFKNAFVASLSAIGYEQGSTVHFIDDWSVYHENYGDVHCGTQVRRAPSRVDWWMHEGN